MREYIRAASIAKMAKVRLWESENMAAMQLNGGGGGEMQAFRTLSQHVKVYRLGPGGGEDGNPPSPKAGEEERTGLARSARITRQRPRPTLTAR